MLNKAIDISVVVVTFNQQNSIPQTLDSILSQRHGYSIEIIIGEDGSSDNTRAVCEQYAAQHPETIKLMPKAPNKGVLRNYADCLSVCRGKYIASCAGDDWWSNPAKLQMQVDFLENNPDYGVVHTDFDVHDVKSGKIVKASLNRIPPEGDVFVTLLRANFITAGTCLYRRDLLQYVDFAAYMKAGIKIEDYPMWLEMSQYTKIHYINQSTITYSVLDNSLSHSTDIGRQLDFIDQVYLIQQYFLSKYPQSDFRFRWLNTIYHRTRYMVFLDFKQYKSSFVEVPLIGFGRFRRIVLRTYFGSIICHWILCSKLYKRTKDY